jgi:hypothetical protein
MADPRDTARRWLAEVLLRTGRVFRDDAEDTAAAILAGVEVTTILRPIDDSRRIALLLPAEAEERTDHSARPVDATHYRRVQIPQGERIAYLPPGMSMPDDWTLL